jgi:hypothetical protein
VDVIASTIFGAGGRTRTDMSVTSPDFESGAYTNFATPAFGCDMIRPVPTQRKLPFLEDAPKTSVPVLSRLLRPRSVQNVSFGLCAISFSLYNPLYCSI